MKFNTPVLIAGIATVSALVVALVFQNFAGVIAIVLAGAGLVFALREPDGVADDRELLADELALLHDADSTTKDEIDRLRGMIDDLAAVVEQLAAEPQAAPATAEDSEAAARVRSELNVIKTRMKRIGEIGPLTARLDKLENNLRAIQTKKPDPDEPSPAVEALTARLAALEMAQEQLFAAQDRADQPAPEAATADDAAAQDEPPEMPEDYAMPSPDAERLAAPSQEGSNVSNLTARRSLAPAPPRARSGGMVARASGSTALQMEHPETQNSAEAAILPVRLAPAFTPDLGPPVAFFMEPAKPEDAVKLALFERAAAIAARLDGAGREVGLFLHVSHELLASEPVVDGALALLEDNAALKRRLRLVIDQEHVDDAGLETLGRFASQDCMFALAEIEDWAFDIGRHIKAGMRYVVLDGCAMAASAARQGGDPAQLSEALGKRDVVVIAGKIPSRERLDEALTLRPTMVTGDGLGAPRVLQDA